MFGKVLHRMAVSEVKLMPQTMHRSYPCQSGFKVVGYVLLALGIVLLFVCIPSWAWLALLGVLLIAAGWLILRMCSTWR